MDLVARVAHRFRLANQVPFRTEAVKRIQADLGVFIENVKHIVTEADHARVEKAARVWGKDVKETFSSLRRQLSDVTEKEIADPKKAERQIEAWTKKIYPLFNAGSEVSMIPSWEYWPQRKFEWARKLADIAEALSGVITFLGTLKRKKIDPLVHERTEEIMQIEGFKVMLVEYDPTKHAEYLEPLREGLKHYRQRAAGVLPILLRKAIPFELRFDKGGVGSMLASYSSTAIQVYPLSSMSLSPKDFAKTIAHEMGHYLWESYLSGDMQNFWNAAISRDSGTLDLREVVDAWRPGEAWYTFDVRMRDENPTLYLQIQAAEGFAKTVPRELREDNWSRENIEAYLAKGGSPLVKAPKTPITGYAATNPQEAFCEALGLAVSFGPRVLHPLIRSWLSTLFPEIKIARLLA